jgi:hypothetical protein
LPHLARIAGQLPCSSTQQNVANNCRRIDHEYRTALSAGVEKVDQLLAARQ